MNFKFVMVALTSFVSVEALFGSSLRKLKDKATQIYQSKFGKDKTWHFLGHELTEYPGSNEKYIAINEEKWNEYYKCLAAQNDNLGKYLSVTPEALLAFEGNSIKLQCKICISPKERQNIESVEWEWAPEHSKQFQPIEITEHVIISPLDKTLHLYDLGIDISGQYVCRLAEALTAPYYLTVVNMSDSSMIEVHSLNAPVGPYPQEPLSINGTSLILDTTWSDWSPCSTCGTIGRRHKLGYCAVFDNDIREEVLTTLENETRSARDIEIELKKKQQDLNAELLTIFKFGIPCNSHILPKSLKDINEVQNRKNEIMIGYCKVKCPENKIFEVRDKSGKVIERANNSAGIYSMLQTLPDLEPVVERRLLYGVKGKDIVISCPGNLNNDAPIQWQIGNKNLVPELISAESGGRIFISITDRVHIKKAKTADSNIYSCWQQNSLAGTVRLIVEKKIEMNFNHHLMLFGIIVILSVFLYVFLKAYVGRKYAVT